MGRKADVPHLMQFHVRFPKHNYYLFVESEFEIPVCLVKPQLEDLYAWVFSDNNETVSRDRANIYIRDCAGGFTALSFWLF